MSSCTDFQENAWRRDLCVNCLKHRQDHAAVPAQAKPSTPVKPKLLAKPVNTVGSTTQSNNERFPKFVKPKTDIQIVKKSSVKSNQRNSDSFPAASTEDKENEISRSISYDCSQSLKKLDASQSPSKRKASDKRDDVDHKSKKERVRSVGFTADDPEIIGYDGGLLSHADDEEEEVFEGNATPGVQGPTPGVQGPMSEEEKQFATLTFDNTRRNSSLESVTRIDNTNASSRSLEYEDVNFFRSQKCNKESQSDKTYGTFPMRSKMQSDCKESVSSIFRANHLDDLRGQGGVLVAEKLNRFSLSSQSTAENSSDYGSKLQVSAVDHYKSPLSITTECSPSGAAADHYKIPTSESQVVAEPNYFVLDIKSLQTTTRQSPLSPSELAHQKVPVEAYQVTKSPKHQFARPYRVVDLTPSSIVSPYTIVDVSTSLPLQEPDSEAPALPTSPAPGPGQERAGSPPQKAAKTSPTHKTASPKSKPPPPRPEHVENKSSDADKGGIYEPVGIITAEKTPDSPNENPFIRNEHARLSATKNPAFAAKMATIAKTVDFSKTKQKRHAPSPPSGEGSDDKVKISQKKQTYATRLNNQENYLSNKDIGLQAIVRPVSPPLDVAGDDSYVKERKDKKGKSFFKKLLKFRSRDTGDDDLSSVPGALSPEAKLYVESWLASSLEHVDDSAIFSDEEGSLAGKEARKDISEPVLMSRTSCIEGAVVRSTSVDSTLQANPSNDNKEKLVEQSNRSVKKSPCKRPPPPPPPGNKSTSPMKGASSDAVDQEQCDHLVTSPHHKLQDSPGRDIKVGTSPLQRKVPVNIRKTRPPPPPVGNRQRSSTLPAETLAVDRQYRVSTFDVVSSKKKLSKQVSLPSKSHASVDHSLNRDGKDDLDHDCPSLPPPDPPRGGNHYEQLPSEGSAVLGNLKKEENMYDLVGAPSSEGNTCSTCNSQGSALEGYLEPITAVTLDSMKEIEKQLKRHSQEVIAAELEIAMRESGGNAPVDGADESQEPAPVPMPRRRTKSRNSDSVSTVLSVQDPYVLVWKQDTQSQSPSHGRNFELKVCTKSPHEQTLGMISDLNSGYVKQMLSRIPSDKSLDWCLSAGCSFQWVDFNLVEGSLVCTSQGNSCYRAQHKSTTICVLALSQYIQHGSSEHRHVALNSEGSLIFLPTFTTQSPPTNVPVLVGTVDVTVIPTSSVSELKMALCRSIQTNTVQGYHKAALYLLELCKLLSVYHETQTVRADRQLESDNQRTGWSVGDVLVWSGDPGQHGCLSLEVKSSNICEDNQVFLQLMSDMAKVMKSSVGTDAGQFNDVLKFLSEMNRATLGDHQVVLECFLWGPGDVDRRNILESTDQVEATNMWLTVEKTKLLGLLVTTTTTPAAHQLEFLIDVDAVKLCEVIKLFSSS